MPTVEAKKLLRSSVRGLEVLAGHGKREPATDKPFEPRLPASSAARGQKWARPFWDRLSTVVTRSVAVSRLAAERGYHDWGTHNLALGGYERS